MTEWVLVMMLGTAPASLGPWTASGLTVVPGFTSKARCEAAAATIFKPVGKFVYQIGGYGGHPPKGRNADIEAYQYAHECLAIEK